MNVKQQAIRVNEELHFALEREMTDDPNLLTLAEIVLDNSRMAMHLAAVPDGEILLTNAFNAALYDVPWSANNSPVN